MSQLLSKARFKSEQFIYFVASTFKPNGSSSSTDKNQEKSNYKDWKSESNLVEALISSPKVRLPINQTNPHFQLSLSCLDLATAIIRGMSPYSTKAPPKNRLTLPSSNCLVKIECVQSLLACWKKNISSPPHTSTPPGSTCRVFTSPPPPLVIRKLQGGGTSNLVPNTSCCLWSKSVQMNIQNLVLVKV